MEHDKVGAFDSHPLPSGRDCLVNHDAWKQFVNELKEQWKRLWRERLDDKVRAEGIASRDYSLLFVERGTVVIATKDYKPLEFSEILRQHLPLDVQGRLIPPHPAVGGWRKFIRESLNKSTHRKIRRRTLPTFTCKKQQLKKGGRGWLHYTV